MKKYSKLALMLAVAGLTSCDVLDQDPKTEIAASSAFADAKSASVALNGLYSQLQNSGYYGGFFQQFSDLASDVSQTTTITNDLRELDTYVVTAANATVTTLWNVQYTVINHANNILAEVPKITSMDAGAKNTILGQAYFIRGLTYFDLTRTFGGVPGVVGALGVPLVMDPTKQIDNSSFVPRASLQESYSMVEADLLHALELVPETYSNNNLDRSRAVKATVRALLARLYLYTRDYEQARTFSEAVINDSRYALVANFSNIFSSEFTSESVFELDFGTADNNVTRSNYFPAALGGTASLALHDELWKTVAARPADTRKLFAYDPDASRKLYYPTKYNKLGGVDNLHLIRIAELYLIRAEANAHLGNIQDSNGDLNLIRKRAGLADTLVATQGGLLSAVEKENYIEFFGEGHRWFDLVRTNRAMDVLKNLTRFQSLGGTVSLPNVNRQVLPIPQIEIDVNANLEQNAEY